MPEIRIDTSELKSEGAKIVGKLAEYLEDRTKLEVETATDEIMVMGEGRKVTRRYLRVLLRKFLHREELKKYFRVIGGRDNSWIVKEKRIYKEE